ncbi:MAG: T9SS type A sorting domain-containing protein [Cytophagales bacterium]|nr:T9SS type A sorting domain-containing protein [Cytophagales bacterium]
MLKYFLLIFLSIIINIIPATAMKGKILIVGGGTERNSTNAWSNAPYQWAVNQSNNKKVAIIGVSIPASDPNWLPYYFVQLGAVSAKNFAFNSFATANQAWVYDTLMTYDVIFFRGGDQSQYYNYYKNTYLMNAVKDKFNSGGVIAGTSAGLHILSGVIYNALDISITSDQALNNVNHAAITLANDVFALFPGYIFDSHFNERGRFGRLLSFMANWRLRKNEFVSGIGVDDLTALAIDTNEVGEAYGTGSVHIYSPTYYSVTGTTFYSDSIHAVQLLNGWKYNFKNKSVTALTNTGTNIINTLNETFAGTIILSGSDAASANDAAITEFVQQTGNIDDPILILTGSSTVSAVAFAEAMSVKSATSVNIARLVPSDTSTNSSTLRYARKYWITDITFGELTSYIGKGKAGKKIDSVLHVKGAILAFAGSTSRMVGKRMVSDNYLSQDAAYTGALVTSQGLALLGTFYIMPNTFSNSNMYENAASSVPYFVLKDSLAHGVWIHGNSFMKYYINAQSEAQVISMGSYPAILIRNKTAKYGFSTTTSRGDGTQQPRQVAGHEGYKLYVLSANNPLKVGSNINVPLVTVPSLPKPIVDNLAEMPLQMILLYPNPATDMLNISNLAYINSYLEIYNIVGNMMMKCNINSIPINISHLPAGQYMARIVCTNHNQNIPFQVIK